MSITDKLLIDACEFMNVIYEDMSSINELISIKKINGLIPEGVCLFFKGFLIVNSLEPKYFSKVIQKCKMAKLFEGGSMHQSAGPEIIVDLFTFGKYLRRAQAETQYTNVKLMEDFVQNNLMDRYEDQKKSGGDKGNLDDSSGGDEVNSPGVDSDSSSESDNESDK